ncbi:MAG: hypothetical protein JWM93_3985 [Frankiales bacterium]|nr:hypothetical protein [Frankiales bacterium]
MTRDRRPRWNCREPGCGAWGVAEPGENAGDLQHAHYLECHYQPPEDP